LAALPPRPPLPLPDMLIVELILWIELCGRAARVYIGARPSGSEWAFLVDDTFGFASGRRSAGCSEGHDRATSIATRVKFNTLLSDCYCSDFTCTMQISSEYISALVKTIHASNKQALTDGGIPKQLVIANTGVGNTGIANLFKVPGASASILETITTYAYLSTDDFLHRHGVVLPDGTGYSCFERAQSLGLAAWKRASTLSSSAQPIGVGMTGSIITVDDAGNPRILRGGHRADLVIYTSATEFKSFHLDMQPGLRDRDGEETLCGNFLVMGIYDALAGTNELAHIYMEQLLAGDACVTNIRFTPAGFEANAIVDPKTIIYPGSYNPLHPGHIGIETVLKDLNPSYDILYEISVKNISKPTLTSAEIFQRIQQFMTLGKSVVVTSVALFLEKAKLFPKCSFAMGFDTFDRLFTPRTSGWDSTGDFNEYMFQRFHPLIANDTKFFVFGRQYKDAAGVEQFMSADSIYERIPNFHDNGISLHSGFVSISESVFRADVSSTELRNKK
jgi:hypothetical protein